MDGLVTPEHMCGCNTRAGRANIECFRQLHELGSRGVRTTHENRHLQPDPRRPTALGLIQVVPFLEDFAGHALAP
jgi:hypothetical protein